MSEEAKKTYTFEQRKAGAEALLNALKAEGIEGSVTAERGKVELFDSIFVRVTDKKGVPAGDLSISATGYINIKASYTDGDSKVFARAVAAAAELQGSDVKAGKFTKTRPAPGGGNLLRNLEA